jgi:shikimate kinase
MGVGKSTVGRALASALAVPFVDADEVIAQRYGPIPEQFDNDGEAAFRKRERDLVVELAGRAPLVLATGGGLWVDARNREALRAYAHRVVLTAPFEVIAARIAGDPGRPLADRARVLYEARQSAYADTDLEVQVAGRPVDEIVEEIRRWLP